MSATADGQAAPANKYWLMQWNANHAADDNRELIISDKYGE
jgi:hypothetical protein